MKKNILILLVFSLVLLTILPQTSAFFTRSHEYWILKALEDEPSSMVAKLCGDRPDLLIDGNTGNDITIIHYTDDKVQSYIFLHQKFSFDKCLQEAGSNKEKQCLCFGSGTHQIGDGNAHIKDALVPKYIRKYFSSNLVGHMAIEYDYEIKHMKLIEDDSVVTSGQLDFYDSRVLDNFFTETGGNDEYIELYSTLSGLSFQEFKGDAQIFRSGYTGEGFFNTVYNEKIQLPSIFWIISIGLIIIGAGVAILLILLPFFGVQMTIWRFIIVGIYLFVALVGTLLIVSLMLGTTWEWVRLSLNVVPISISDADVQYYNDVNLRDHKEFFRTGRLVNDDVSGLDYQNSATGALVEGELGKAETPFKWFMILIIAPLFALVNIFLFYKTFKVKVNKKGALNKLMNLLGIVLGLLFLLIFIIWLVFVIFI